MYSCLNLQIRRTEVADLEAKTADSVAGKMNNEVDS